MSFIQYSPWQDAANVGQGIGSSIAKVLFELPMMKRRLAQEDQELGLRERSVAVQEELAGPRGEQIEAMKAYRQAMAVAALQNAGTKERVGGTQVDLNNARKNKLEEEAKFVAPKAEADIRLKGSSADRNDMVTREQPGVNAALNELRNAMRGNKEMDTMLAPHMAETRRAAVKVQEEMLGKSTTPKLEANKLFDAMQQRPQALPSQAPQPQPPVVPTPVPGTNPISLPRIMEGVTATADAPPDNVHTVKVRDIRTGQEFWTNNIELLPAHYEDITPR